MPYIHFNNIESEIIESFSNDKLEEFSEIANASLENIYVIDCKSKIVNQSYSSYIKIEWMPRTKNDEEAVVKFINDFLLESGMNKSSIYFVDIDKEHYYTGNLK